MAAIATRRVTCASCPVQIEGQLDDGRAYYFRARHSAAQLGIADTPAEAVQATMPLSGRGTFLGVQLVGDVHPHAMGGLSVEAGHKLLDVLFELAEVGE